MAIKQHDIKNNPYAGNVDHKIMIPLNHDYYKMRIGYSGFVPGAGTGFKVHSVVSTDPKESELVEIPDSEQIIDDASGNVQISNINPEKADFLVLEYTSDGNDPASTFSVNMSSRS